MAQAMQKIATKVKNGQIEPKDVDILQLEKEMYTGDDPDLNIMIRTSGETRFSDFMIWQGCDNCSIEFTPTLWPAMGPWDIFKILFKYSYKATRQFQVEEIRQSKRNDVILGLNAYKSKKPVVKQEAVVLPNVEHAPGGKPPKISVTEVARNDAVLAG